MALKPNGLREREKLCKTEQPVLNQLKAEQMVFWHKFAPFIHPFQSLGHGSKPWQYKLAGTWIFILPNLASQKVPKHHHC